MKTYSTIRSDRTGWGRRGSALVCALIVLFIGRVGPALADGGAPKFREYEVKAAFLLNFMHFVEWPAGVSTNVETPILIGILGEDPFGSLLEESIKDDTFLGRPVAVKRRRHAADMKDCHLVFVCRSEKARLSEIVAAFRGYPILTVGDSEQFCEQGGMIGLVTEGGRIRFEISQQAAERGELKISSKLLRLARGKAP